MSTLRVRGNGRLSLPDPQQPDSSPGRYFQEVVLLRRRASTTMQDRRCARWRRGIGGRNAASSLMHRRSLRPFWRAPGRLARLSGYGWWTENVSKMPTSWVELRIMPNRRRSSTATW